ncbi:sugar ABC transporter permease [Jeongeupia wiesaeckerbachi]|uniref:carbohydrate ABC transporter permease n=1 Tax=Jeongeupia wiesaeckerbachi TaxID=3051218 RepID=UPI003D808242
MAMPGVHPRTAYLFIAPFFAVFAVFTLWPMLFNLWLAFRDYFPQTGNSMWNGFAHFVELADSESFGHTLKNSLLFLLLVPLLQAGAFGLALLVHTRLPGIGFFRALYYLPVVIAVSIAAVVWQQVLRFDGLFNWLLESVRLIDFGTQPDWLGNPQLALYAVMAFSFWKNVGYYMVLYLAGLQTVPRAPLEAAQIDGADAWQRLRHVVLPAMQPVILLCTLLSTIQALKTFQEVIVLTGGQADTQTALVFVYGAAFFGHNFGLAAAAGLIVTLACLALAALQLRYFGEHGLLRRGGAV